MENATYHSKLFDVDYTVLQDKQALQNLITELKANTQNM
jgi:hypothetical protein